MNNRIVAVLGDYYHREDWLQQALQEAVGAVNHALIQEESAYELLLVPYTRLAEALQDQPRLVVLSKEERLYPEEEDKGSWLHADCQEAVVRYVESGGSWLAWHSGLAYRTDGPYRRMLRGWFLHHPVPKAVKYELAENNVLQLSQEDSFSIRDEHYFVHCEEFETNVFLRSTSDDGSSIAGWTHEVGQGRVCCLTPAHDQNGLQDAALLKLLASCINYCLREV